MHARNPDAFFDDLDAQEIIVLNLVRACEQVIDIASIVVRDLKLNGKSSASDKFGALAAAGVIDEDMARGLRGMVSFRNIAVHQYRELNLEIVRAIITKHLKELTLFADLCLAALADLES